MLEKIYFQNHPFFKKKKVMNVCCQGVINVHVHKSWKKPTCQSFFACVCWNISSICKQNIL